MNTEPSTLDLRAQAALLQSRLCKYEDYMKACALKEHEPLNALEAHRAHTRAAHEKGEALKAEYAALVERIRAIETAAP